MQQEGVDLYVLLSYEVDGHCRLIVWIHYFSKWSEPKSITNKTVPTIAQFLYQIMCRHGCCAIQINDQGREIVKKVSDELYLLTGVQQWLTNAHLVNGCFAIPINEKSRHFFKEVSDEVHLLTGVQQRVTSAYHPLSNGLVKRQNRTIKKFLVNSCFVIQINDQGREFVNKGIGRKPTEIGIYNWSSAFCSSFY